MDERLPIPTYLEHLHHGYLISYQIDGHFDSEKGIEYINDMIGRFLITFHSLRPLLVDEKPRISERGHHHPSTYRLADLQNLQSLSKKNLMPQRADAYHDHTFWCIKLFCEDLIRTQGMVPYAQLEAFATRNFRAKERSSLRAKCRSIWRWYDERDWKISKEKKEIKMTREERAKKNSKNRAQKKKQAVINAITGLYADEYRKGNGSWHILKISEATNVSRNIVSKYLKEFEESQRN